MDASTKRSLGDCGCAWSTTRYEQLLCNGLSWALQLGKYFLCQGNPCKNRGTLSCALRAHRVHNTGWYRQGQCREESPGRIEKGLCLGPLVSLGPLLSPMVLSGLPQPASPAQPLLTRLLEELSAAETWAVASAAWDRDQTHCNGT